MDDYNKYFADDDDIIELNENIGNCKNCKSTDIRQTTDYFVCFSCGTCQDKIIFEKWIYKFGLNYITIYSRFNHWKKILRSVQSEQVAFVPNTIIRKLRNEKFNTIQELKIIMIKHKMKRYYLSIYWIYNQLKNKILIEFDKITKWKLLTLFQEISSTFNELDLGERKNFLHYHFVLIKILRWIGETKSIKHLFSMKDTKKIKYSEDVIKKISKKLGLEFIAEPNIRKRKTRKYCKKV